MADDHLIAQNAWLTGANRAHVANTQDAYDAVALANSRITSLNARLAQAEDVVAQWRAAAELAQMNVEGLIAQRDAWRAQHPNSPLLADSGRRFKDGDTKTKIRLIFEAAFDACGHRMKISNPASRRED